MNDFWHLHNFDWLADLPQAEADALRARASTASYEAGDIVFGPSRVPASVYLLESGLVRIYRASELGAETTFGYVNPGEIFGELAAFTDCERESWARAVQSSRVWRIERDAMRTVLSNHPRVAFQVTKQVGSRLKRIESRVEDLVFRDVRSRLGRVLLQLAEDYGSDVPEGRLVKLSVTQEELATLVGATRQSVNAALRELEGSGLVTRSGRFFVLPNREALLRAAHPAVDRA